MRMDRISGRITPRGKIGGSIGGSEKVYGKIGRSERVYVKELRFANHYEFPAIGDSECLYIAKDENATYRYDDEERAYFCVGRDYKEIEAIQVKLKEE